eukprot:GILK01006342.1.p2 GENE.GILK01006342.1~~GILK01006342.1.p2  ORF type:complete len:184 (-),score=18.95 GILK01006342.1:53-544(-)
MATDSQRTRAMIEFGSITDKNVEQLRRMNLVIFPVRYNDKFYKDVVHLGDLVKLAYYNDILVGSICSREEERAAGGKSLYIMTLGVLAPYRRLKVGSQLLESILEICKRRDIVDVYLHVQTNNQDAIEFYKRYGFEIAETIQNYYKRIEPPDCYVLRKQLKSA